MKRLFLCLIPMLLMMLTGCISAEKNPEKDKISVVTTCFPPYDFARAVMGDEAEITMLLCAGAEAHSYEPAPLDIAKIQNCDVFVYVGGEGEVWADKILGSMDTSGKTIIRLFDFVDPLSEEEVRGASPDGHSEAEEEEEEYDEHIWTSPANAEKCIRGIENSLIQAFPDISESFSRGADDYSAKLEELDGEFSELIKNAPKNTILIADRFPFRYFAQEYGIEYYAAFSGCSSESEPGVYTMAYLIDRIIQEDFDTVFYLEFSTQKLAEKLCNATGSKALPLQSCHNVTPADFENGTTYIDLMKQNLNSIQEALY